MHLFYGMTLDIAFLNILVRQCGTGSFNKATNVVGKFATERTDQMEEAGPNKINEDLGTITRKIAQ